MSAGDAPPPRFFAASAVIAHGAELGPGSSVGEFCIVGQRSGAGPVRATVIGAGAILRSHTVIYEGNRAGARFQTGHHTLVREDNDIGDDVSIGSATVVEHHVRIGNGVRIHSAAFIPELTILEDGCWIGPRVTFTNAPFPRCPDVGACMRGVIVRRAAKVGANATILPGVVIGERAVVGAGAVVTRDVAEATVVAGNPARAVKAIGDLVCPAGLDHVPYPGV